MISNTEMMNTGFLRRSCHASDQRLRGLPCLVGMTSTRSSATTRSSAAAALVPIVGVGSSVIANPWVEDGIEQVDDQVHQQEDDHQEDHDPDHDETLLVQDRGVDEVADA